ncbi:mechanosensitive ion channel family protein [Abyssalbus ytuae]|uniref:Mechanosensitive ion channel n=1 Tax=Abyssalbus ytuae TaxID=2926907 RepID=A0A9E6ZRV3_9FLAO|nr:mechanosensitive ion channel family protein [Abyssalbus ytuae]UOB16723.1 mechanosensitive ion channel [Abyssalbus ytuae]
MSLISERLYEAWSKMLDKLESWLDILVINLPNIFIALVVFIIVLVTSKYLSKLILRLLQRSNLQRSMKSLISKLVSVLVILIGLFLILGILNLSKTLNTILAGAGVAGLAVGLALQGALANTYSGIILSYVKYVKFGDWIESNGFEGEVIDIDLRTVTVKQADNNLVYIPNKLVIENPIKNFSSTSQSKVILECGVDYSSDLEFVKELTVSTLHEAFEEVKKKEDVIFLYEGFGDSSINFKVLFQINSTSALEVAKAKTEAMIVLKKAFDGNDINIPFPIRTLDFPEGFNILSKENNNKE